MSFKSINQTPKKKITKKFFYSWEMILVYLLVAINILLMIFVSDVYFTFGNIQTIIRCGMEISFMVLGMTFILILGEIDVSVASIMLLSAMVMGVTYENMVGSAGEGAAAFIAVVMGVIAGGCCGLLNGILVSVIKMPSVITTIGTSFLFRGIVHVSLGGDFKANFPKFFEPLAWDDIGGVIPVSLVVFLLFAAFFCVILHRSKFGRQLYLVGNNRETANYSGIRVAKTKIMAFVILGMTAALSAMVFVGRLGGIDYTMATGYELKVIAVVVLGGVSTLGGKGKLYGPIIATFFMAFLLKSLDLFQVQQNVQKIAIGIILILAVLIPRMNKNTFLKLKLKFTRKNLRQIEGTDIPHNIDEAKKKIVDLENKMSTTKFYRFVRQTKLTTNPINNKITHKDVMLANNEYLLYATFLKGLDKRDQKVYNQVLSQIKEKRDILESAKDDYALKLYVNKQMVKTIHKLIKLNRSIVKDEIKSNAKKFINNYRYKHYALDDIQLTDHLNNLVFTNWKVQNELKLSNVTNAFNDLINKQKTLSKAWITRKVISLDRLITRKQRALINFYITNNEYKIASCCLRNTKRVNETIKRLNKKNQEIINYEKK